MPPFRAGLTIDNPFMVSLFYPILVMSSKIRTFVLKIHDKRGQLNNLAQILPKTKKNMFKNIYPTD